MSRARAAAVLLLAAVLATGCRDAGPDRADVTAPPADVAEATGDAEVLYELVAVGGMCPTGECLSVTTVDRAGAWTVSGEDGRVRTGTLPDDLLAELTAEVDATAPGSLTGTPFTGECERDMDGTEWILTLLPGNDAEQRVSTCEHVLPDVPLLGTLEEVGERTRA